MAVQIDNEQCTGCGSCVEICPLDAISLKNGKAVISDNCAECGVCVDECTREAITL